MNRKIIPLLIVLIGSLCCLGMVSADNNTTGNLTDGNVEDMMDYVMPIHITDNGIEFSDGFIGFCIDSKKPAVTANDHFSAQPTKNEVLENHIKLAIIEAYKAGKEDNLGDIVLQVINGNKEHDIVEAVFNSTETVNDTATVALNNTTEATFTFELLTSQDGSKSDCLAYKVSMKEIETAGVLKATNDDANQSVDNESAVQTSASENATAKTDDAGNKTAAAGGDNQSDDGQTIINETNKTIINKTNTVIVNENNTTVINKNNTKVINKTNDNPQNATVQQKIMRTVGNPIFLLAIVIVIIAVVGVVMRRKN